MDTVNTSNCKTDEFRKVPRLPEKVSGSGRQALNDSGAAIACFLPAALRNVRHNAAKCRIRGSDTGTMIMDGVVNGESC